MPCSDCIGVKAELAAQKTLMVEWFQGLCQEMKSSQAMTGEVLEKLTSLETTVQVQFS